MTFRTPTRGRNSGDRSARREKDRGPYEEESPGPTRESYMELKLVTQPL